MGIETIALVGTLVSAATSVMGGMQQMSAGNDQAELAAQQAESRAIEEERLSAKQARIEQEQADSLARRQKVAFLSSGVSLEGTPLMVLAETRRKGQENVEEVQRAGAAAGDATRAEGRARAASLKSSGRAAFTQSLGQGISTAATGYTNFKKLS